AQSDRGAKAAERVPAEFGSRHGLRRNRRGSKLRNVTVAGDQPRNAPASEPRAQAIDQAVELDLICARAEADLLLRTGLGGPHPEPRHAPAHTPTHPPP